MFGMERWMNAAITNAALLIWKEKSISLLILDKEFTAALCWKKIASEK